MVKSRDRKKLGQAIEKGRFMSKQGCCIDSKCNENTCMNLPEDKKCGDCIHIIKCKMIYGHIESDTYCDWFPRKFRQKQD